MTKTFKIKSKIKDGLICECEECMGYIGHSSDCSVHREPLLPKGKCDCIINNSNL